MSGVAFVGRARNAVKRLGRCAAMDPALTVQLLAWRLALPVLKRTVSISALVRFMSAPPLSLDDHQRRQAIERVQRFFSTGGRLLISGNCLERSLVLYRLLSRANARPDLMMGARKDDSFAAHAWIVLEGEALGEPDVDRFAPVVKFGSNGRPSGISSIQNIA